MNIFARYYKNFYFIKKISLVSKVFTDQGATGVIGRLDLKKRLYKKVDNTVFLAQYREKIYINFIFSAILRKNLYQFYFLRNIEKKFIPILQYCHLVGNSQLTNGSPGLFTEKSGNIRPVSDKLPPYFRKTLELNGISRHCYNFDET